MARSLFKGRLRILLPFVLILIPVLFLWHRKNHPGTGGGYWHRAALEVGAPLQRAAAWVLGLPEGLAGGARRWLHLESENARLGSELRTAQLEASRLRGLEAELRALRETLRKVPVYARPGLPAAIVAQDASTWNRSFVIDAGTGRGVQEDGAVLSVQGVVGRVWSVSEGSARVLSILDPASSVSGIDVRSRVKGLARGTGRNRMMFEYVNTGSDIEPGDLIVTSGLGGVFPRNIPLGTVVKRGLSEDGLVMVIELAPSVEFGSLEHVFVLEPERP
jgi:rod shape-determining protein MreC